MKQSTRANRARIPGVVCVVILLMVSAFSQTPSTTPASGSSTPATTTPPDAPSAVSTSAPAKKREGGAAQNWHDFTHEVISPLTPLTPAITAAFMENSTKDSAFGSGVHGYFNRYGVAMADSFNGKFLRHFALPTIFNQVEHYKPLGDGNGAGRRIGHAFVHTFIVKTPGGHDTVNMAGIPGSVAIAVIGDGYYPDRYTTTWHTAQRAAWMQLGYFGGDLWHEFRPDVCRIAHLPCGKLPK